jgi:hypothetical protein
VIQTKTGLSAVRTFNHLGVKVVLVIIQNSSLPTTILKPSLMCSYAKFFLPCS